MRRIGSDEEDSQGDDDRDRLGDIMVGTEWEVGRPIFALAVCRLSAYSLTRWWVRSQGMSSRLRRSRIPGVSWLTTPAGCESTQ
jgi:hypothetical protein